MGQKRFVIDFYKNANAGFHIQKISNSIFAREEHSHDYFQIYYILRGSLTHITEGEKSQLVKGDTFIIPPGKNHQISQLQDVLFYSFSFTRESLNLDQISAPLISRFVEDIKNGPPRAKLNLNDESLFLMENLMERLFVEFSEKPIGYVDAIRAYATILLTLLARHHYDEDTLPLPPSDNRSRILHCIEYVEQNYGEPLTLSDMTKWTAMSTAEFCKHFKALSGQTFGNFLHQTRIKNAKLLIDKGVKISIVSDLCGYNDFSSFYRNFTKIIGLSPTQYKKLKS